MKARKRGPSLDDAARRTETVAMSLTAATLLSATLVGTPWYARDACLEGLRTVHTQDLEAGRAAIEELSKSKDLDLRLCGLWLEIPFGNAELVLNGRSEEWRDRREERLKALYGVARKYGSRRGPEWTDLMIEARMRRAQVLAQRKERLKSMQEARAVERALAERNRPDTAVRAYTEGAVDLAVGQAAWGLRMLLSAAGIDGDPDRGKRTLEALARGETVYATEALMLLVQLSRKQHGGSDPRTLRYGARLVRRHPDSPQFVYDHADNLRKAGRCAEALELLAPFRARLEEDSQAWSPKVRRKLHGLTARCALAVRDYPLAQQAHARARAQDHWALTDALRAVADALAQQS